jgi:hypothetical protein
MRIGIQNIAAIAFTASLSSMVGCLAGILLVVSGLAVGYGPTLPVLGYVGGACGGAVIHWIEIKKQQVAEEKDTVPGA